METLNTYSVSMNVYKNGRDYELETMFEATSPKNAAMIFLKDWIEEIFYFKNRELYISVSEPHGCITYFIVKNNILSPLD